MTTDTLPCLGHADLYDLVLFEEDTQPSQRTEALHRAAALCASCPSPCDQKVTADTGPRELVLLEPGWMPPTREGRPEPEAPAFGKPRSRQPAIKTGQDYVPTHRRVEMWARMSAARAVQGYSLAQIAVDLCVSEDTAAALVDHAQQKTAHLDDTLGAVS